MVRQRKRMTEGVLRFFSRPDGLDHCSLSEYVSVALKKNRCGKVLGHGMSLQGDPVFSIEIGSTNCDKADDVIALECQRLKCNDYDIEWD